MTGSLIEKNKKLANLLYDIELLEEKLKGLEEMDMEQKLLHFKVLFLDEFFVNNVLFLSWNWREIEFKLEFSHYDFSVYILFFTL